MKDRSLRSMGIIRCSLAALVVNDKLFLARRAKEPCKGLWNAPGGKYDLEKDRTIVETCLRELKEETNLVARVCHKIYTTQRPGNDGKQYLIDMYLCAMVGPYEPQLDAREFDRYELLGISEIHRVQKTDHVTEQLVPYLIQNKHIR
jgi:ADP-ribose pyrophosphatase YjhB (NUDIX family)